MNVDIFFIINAAAFGVGLAMDAFSVSLANGLNEPDMKLSRMCLIAGTFCGFQILMPIIGWFCVKRAAEAFSAFRPFIPWIALILLLYIGGNMLREGIRGRGETEKVAAVGIWELMIQGVATSIDALSVGFTISDLNAPEAVLEAVIIGAVTFVICIGGLKLGRRFGTKLSGKAGILGGIILIVIGLKIVAGSML